MDLAVVIHTMDRYSFLWPGWYHCAADSLVQRGLPQKPVDGRRRGHDGKDQPGGNSRDVVGRRGEQVKNI